MAAFNVVPVSVPTIPNVLPIVAELLTVNALIVLLPLILSLVKIAVLGETLPIGVACMPPSACRLEPNVPELLIVKALAVKLLVTIN